MKLKLTDAVRLASSNIWNYKLRSVAIILTISIIFGLVMGVNFLFAGMRESMLRASLINTDGYSYAAVYVDNRVVNNSGRRKELLASRIEQYHGEVVGEIYDYSIDRHYLYVIDEQLVPDTVEMAPLETVPEGFVPVLVDQEHFEETKNPDALYYNPAFHEQFETVYYLVGYSPELTPTKVLLPGEYNILNLPLSRIGASATTSAVLWGHESHDKVTIIDDGTGRVEQLLQRREEDALANNSYDKRVIEIKVVRFDNLTDLTGFVDTSDMPEGKKSGTNPLVIMPVYSNTASIVEGFLDADTIIMVEEIILLVVAVLVTTFTFIHLIDQDARTVALYRSFGASTGQIVLVYLIYLIELCLIAILVSIGIGLILVAVMSYGNAGILAENMQVTYDLASKPEVSLFGIDGRFFLTMTLVMVTAPIALLLSVDRFSRRRIAMSLKKD